MSNSRLQICYILLLFITHDVYALLSNGQNSIVSNAKVKQLIDKEVEKELQNKSKQYEEKITALENNIKSLEGQNSTNSDKAKQYEDKIKELTNNIKSLEEKSNANSNNIPNSIDNITSCVIQDENKTKMRLQVLRIQKQLEQTQEQNKNNIIQIVSQLDYQKSNDRNKEMQKRRQLHENNIQNNSSAVSIMDNNITELRNGNVWYKLSDDNNTINT